MPVGNEERFDLACTVPEKRFHLVLVVAAHASIFRREGGFPCRFFLLRCLLLPALRAVPG